MLLEGNDGGSQVIDFDLALGQTPHDVTLVQHGRVVVIVLLIVLRTGSIRIRLVLTLDWRVRTVVLLRSHF